MNSKYSEEIKHELWPPIVYVPSSADISAARWARQHQCSVIDLYERQCVREAGHSYECIIPEIMFYVSGGKTHHDYDRRPDD